MPIYRREWSGNFSFIPQFKHIILIKIRLILLSGRRIVHQASMGIPVTSVGACTSDLHITSYSSTTHIGSHVSAVDRHLSAGSLDPWENLLNLWNGTAAL